MSGHEIIRSATADAARRLGVERIGTIDGGKDADLVLVDGDPLTDPTALTSVRRVWRKGVTAR
jgi:imidazolonepropionase-like amidohydrolase